MIDHILGLIETGAVVFGAITTASLVFANSIHKRMVRAEDEADKQARARTPEGVAATKEAIVEKRRILERRRSEYCGKAGKLSLSDDPDERISQWESIKDIETKLLKLAEEEAKIHVG